MHATAPVRHRSSTGKSARRSRSSRGRRGAYILYAQCFATVYVPVRGQDIRKRSGDAAALSLPQKCLLLLFLQKAAAAISARKHAHVRSARKVNTLESDERVYCYARLRLYAMT